MVQLNITSGHRSRAFFVDANDRLLSPMHQGASPVNARVTRPAFIPTVLRKVGANTYYSKDTFRQRRLKVGCTLSLTSTIPALAAQLPPVGSISSSSFSSIAPIQLFLW